MKSEARPASADLPALGFDIGGSSTKIGIVSRSGQMLAVEHLPTDVETIGLEAFLSGFLDAIEKMLALADRNVAGIGGTFLGWIDDARRGPFLCLNAPSLHGLDLQSILLDRFDLPVALIDDSSAHLLAEYTFGSGRGVRRFMNLAMGTGLTAGVVINGKPLDFTFGCIGDTGHLILRPGGPTCSAGCKGCAEALIGVEGIERLSRQIYGRPVTARQVIERARDGSDIQARAVIQEVGGYAGELLASLSHIFLPERITLTGGTANAGEILLLAVRERFYYLTADYHQLYASLSNGAYNGVEIVLGKVLEHSGLIGSTVHLFSTITNQPDSKKGN
jgi:glucokinase